MVNDGHARTYINRQVFRVKRMFKWAAWRELISADKLTALGALESLGAGRTAARETDPVRPVADDIVDATVAVMLPTLATMVTMQRLSGMRPNEVCIMRTCDLNMGNDVWVYSPEHHKTDYKGRHRRVYLGRQSHDVLRPFLLRNVREYLFTPEQSERERREAMHIERTTPVSCGNRPGSNVKNDPQRRPG